MRRLGSICAILTGFGLRLYQLGAESLWYDETVSVVLARKSLAGLFAHTAGDIHPPGYYILLHYWQALTHPTLTHGLEFLFAWPSLCFGVLILALIYALGRRLLNVQAALLAVWLGAINPFHIWYSQEVRMYTMGAALGLICLCTVITYWQSGSHNERTAGKDTHPTPLQPQIRNAMLVIYACAAATGLYTLYYFLFTIIALNLIVLWLAGRQTQTWASFWRALRGWMLAQVGVLLLWSPWLPIFYRQAVDPPVPPWRVPWHTLADFVNSVAEGALALFLGQSFFDIYTWFWIVAITAVFILFYRYLRLAQAASHAGLIIGLFLCTPIALIYGLTAAVTPLYHVRYLFTYAPLFLLLLAAAILALNRLHWTAATLVSLLYIGASFISLQRFWFDPTYRTDDHRSAVSQLAENWRPGDAILGNAGWVYTVLETYWPAQLPVNLQWAVPSASLPPPLAAPERLSAFVGMHPAAEIAAQQSPIVIRTGSVDGAATLGWGNPESDFYAISLADTQTAMTNLFSQYPRIWHYRLYDTVNDPAGRIRTLLAQNAELRSDTPYPGRDYLRVQLYEAKNPPDVAQTEQFDFGDALRLAAYDAPANLQAGHTAYATLTWTALPAANTLGVDLSMSLRLYDADDQLLSQHDEAPSLPTSTWRPGQVVRQPLSVPIPIAARPGPYTLELIVYRQDDGAPLAVPDNERAVLGQRLRLAALDLAAAEAAPYFGPPLAAFDYIELIQSTVDRSEAAAGEPLQITLYWQPQPSAYTDTYNAVIELLDASGGRRQTWREPAGGAAYPSGLWLPERPVRDVKQLQLEPGLPAGAYRLALHLERASDGLRIDARRPWQPFGVDNFTIGSIRIR
ncbi:MAG: glycosyltransferase family 39 protein [Caldilineaceae bacterium]